MIRLLAFGAVTGLIGAGCIAALLVLFGLWDRVVGQPLTARVLVQEIRVPASYRIEPKTISDELVRRMQRRSETDMALRILMGDEGNVRLREQALPRLLNAGVLRRMIADMDGLGTVIEFAGYRSWGAVTITNSGPEPLDDVALTLPGAARIETASGSRIDVRTHDGGLTSLSLGRLEPGAALELAVWFERPAAEVIANAGAIRVGAEGGTRGQVRVHDPAHGWNGADLEIEVWARWLIAGVLAAVACAAFGALMLLIVGLFRPRRINRA